MSPDVQRKTKKGVKKLQLSQNILCTHSECTQWSSPVKDRSFYYYFKLFSIVLI